MLDKAVENSWAIDNAIAQQRLEGLEPSPEVIADLRWAAQGKIAVSDVIVNIEKRFRNDQILQS